MAGSLTMRYLTICKSLLADKNYVISRSALNDRVFNDFGN